jgi:3-phosphoshikimate 1-carboxyvinyltransferase
MTLRLNAASLKGEVLAIPSKSDLHRIMIGAHLAGIDVTKMPVTSEDIAATRDCLLAKNVANCRESGSTLRFLLPVMAALDKEITFTGSGLLPQRPIELLIALLRDHGCTVSSTRIPLVISGKLRPGTFELPGGVSSQFVSGLLFALPLLDGKSEIILTSPLESTGYVNMTINTLKKFGITAKIAQNRYEIAPQAYQVSAAKDLQPEGDWSNAAFWLAAGISVAGLTSGSAQPDKAIKDFLRRMGEPRHGIVMDAAQCPDLVPIMATVMATAQGESRIVNAARLRLKESDRLHAMAVNLNALGGNVKEFPDGLSIHGGNLNGGEVDSFNDHRIAMAMAIASLQCKRGLTLHGAQAVRKSYPHFWDDFKRLGGSF